MTRKAIRPQSRRHIMVFDEDWEWIEETLSSRFGGPGAACRQIIHLYIARMRRREQEILDGAPGAGRSETEDVEQIL